MANIDTLGPSALQSAIDAGYIAQGYNLPEGWTWDRVAARRAQWRSIRPIDVPVATAPGVVAWGVPIMNGAFLKHP